MIGICFQINDWVLCIDENKLYRQDREVSAEPRLINLLHFLAEHAGEVFGREELIQHVWDGRLSPTKWSLNPFLSCVSYCAMDAKKTSAMW